MIPFSCVLLSRINIVEIRIKILLPDAGVQHSTLNGIDGIFSNLASAR